MDLKDKCETTSLEINDWFSNLTDNIDVYITDPPYPFDNSNGSGRFSYVDGQDDMYVRLDWPDLEKIFQKMYDNAADGGRAYVFCNRQGLEKTTQLLQKAGWIERNILIWDKNAFGTGYHWRHAVEYIVYASKGKPKTFVRNAKNIFQYRKPKKSDFIDAINYKPEGLSIKPQQIWADIIKFGCVENDIIADPFAGTNPMSAALYLNKDLFDKIKKAYMNIY